MTSACPQLTIFGRAHAALAKNQLLARAVRADTQARTATSWPAHLIHAAVADGAYAATCLRYVATPVTLGLDALFGTWRVPASTSAWQDAAWSAVTQGHFCSIGVVGCTLVAAAAAVAAAGALAGAMLGAALAVVSGAPLADMTCMGAQNCAVALGGVAAVLAAVCAGVGVLGNLLIKSALTATAFATGATLGVAMHTSLRLGMGKRAGATLPTHFFAGLRTQPLLVTPVSHPDAQTQLQRYIAQLPAAERASCLLAKALVTFSVQEAEQACAVVDMPNAVQDFAYAVQQGSALAQLRPNLKLRLLLQGPPGNGKTSMAKAIAVQSGLPLFTFNAATLVSPLMGRSAQNVERMFYDVRAFATMFQTRVIVLLDEMDALFGKRGGGSAVDDEYARMLTVFLENMDGVRRGQHDAIVMVGATNRFDVIDTAASQRFTFHVNVPRLNARALGQILRQNLRNVDHDLSDTDIDALALQADLRQLSGRQIAQAIDIAWVATIRAAATVHDVRSLQLHAASVRAALTHDAARPTHHAK